MIEKWGWRNAEFFEFSMWNAQENAHKATQTIDKNISHKLGLSRVSSRDCYGKEAFHREQLKLVAWWNLSLFSEEAAFVVCRESWRNDRYGDAWLVNFV